MSNALRYKIKAILIFLKGDYYPFTARLNFDYTNNVTEYKACVIGLHMTIKKKIKVLDVYGGKFWKPDTTLICYQEFIVELMKECEKINRKSKV